MPRPPSPREWTPFQKLLRDRAAELRLSAREIEAASGIQPGTDNTPMVNASTWSRLTTKEWAQPPDPRTVEGLARALRIDIDLIKVSVLETMGIDLPATVPRSPIQLSAAEADGIEDPQARGNLAWAFQKLIEAVQMDARLKLEREGILGLDARSRELYQQHGDLAAQLLDILGRADAKALEEIVAFATEKVDDGLGGGVG